MVFVWRKMIVKTVKKALWFLWIHVSISTTAFAQSTYTIIPKPAHLEPRNGFFVLPKTLLLAVTSTEPALRQLAEDFAQNIGQVTGHDTRVFAGNFRVKEGINFVPSKDPKLGSKGFFLDISPQRIVITAEQPQGFTAGIRALKQLMPKAIHGTQRVQGEVWKIPCCYIEDQP